MQYLSLFKTSFTAWKNDKAPQLAAATAYYTIFSLAPLLVIIISLAGFFFDSATVQTRIIEQAGTMVGAEGAEAISTMLSAAEQSPRSFAATAVGILVLIIGATGLLVALQNAFNSIWKVSLKKEKGHLVATILKRIFSFGLILAIGFLLMVSLVLSAGVSFFIEIASTNLTWLTTLLPLLDLAVSLVVTTALFALLFKYLPDVHLDWRHIIVGAVLTAFFFTAGKSLLGWYLGQRNFTSAYGVAGSLIVLLVWVNYSAQIMFFGVEFTKAYTEERHGLPKPKKYAEYVGLPQTSSAPRARGSLAFVDIILAATLVLAEFKLFKWRHYIKKITGLLK